MVTCSLRMLVHWITRTLYVFAVGVTVAMAQRWTVTVLVEVTAPLTTSKGLSSEPSAGLGCTTTCPTTAPVIVAVPEAHDPAVRRLPPMLPVVPENITGPPVIDP
jgi:hypothetical protein